MGRNRIGYTDSVRSRGAHNGKESKRIHHLCLLGVPKEGRNQIGYITLAFLGPPKWGGIKLATSPLPSRGPRNGEDSNRIHHLCLLGVPKMGRNQIACITLAFLGSPKWGSIKLATPAVRSRGPHNGEESDRIHHLCLLGVPKEGRNQIGYITFAFLGSPKWGGIKLPTSPLSSRGPQNGEESNCLHHPCLLGGPETGRKQIGYITFAFLGSPKWGGIKLATSPLPSRGPQNGEESNRLHQPCVLRGPEMGRNQKGYITFAFLGTPKWGGIQLATSAVPSRGPQSGEESNCRHQLCVLRGPEMGRNQIGYIIFAFLGAPKWGGIKLPASPLPSWGPQNGEESNWLHQPCVLRGPEMGRNQIGYITFAFLESPKWGGIKLATSPLPSRGPQNGEESNWLHRFRAFSGGP